MEYGFDKKYDRINTNSTKWDKNKEIFGREDLIPMWVADSDWPTAPAVIKALEERVKDGILGYTFPGDKLNNTIVEWVNNRYNWEIKRDWIVHTAGVVPSINMAINAFTVPGDEVILQSPVYYPFFTAIKNNGTHIINNQLVRKDNKYRINYKHLENIFTSDNLRDPNRAQVLIFCNPHNPVGRVWSEKEQRKLGEICLENNILVVSDEIHADFVYNKRHLPFASINDDFANNSITLLAPSKTFNIAGLHTSIAIIPDKNIRKQFQNVCAGVLKASNVLGLTAMKAAYEEGEEWLEAQLNYLEDNIEFSLKYFKEYLPDINVYKPEGTYLLWLDFNKLGLNDDKLKELMINRARVALDPGTWFGPGGEGFMRLNVACSRSILSEGLNRIKKAVKGFE